MTIDPSNATERYARGLHRQLRKVNDSPAAARRSERAELARIECERRGVRFLPAQCLRTVFERSGLL